jgi:hypothetical protein
MFLKLTTKDKLFIALQATFIQNEFKLLIENCKIVYGTNSKQTKFKFSSFTKPVNPTCSSQTKNLFTEAQE